MIRGSTEGWGGGWFIENEDFLQLDWGLWQTKTQDNQFEVECVYHLICVLISVMYINKILLTQTVIFLTFKYFLCLNLNLKLFLYD